ncbi:MAG: ABC transporter substrate-binding protein [Candidatus Pacebacteria bacterium]|nr:ABC transporter substrate-binding protein [Candidatus Paceibacterota bacterium]
MNKTKTVLLVVLISLVVVAGIWYGISQQSKKAEQTKPLVIKIGALYPISGDLVDFTKGIKKGVEYAVADFKAEYPNVQVDLIVEDDRSCDKTAVATAMQKLVSVDRVQAVVGVMCSGNVMVAAPIAEQNKVLLMSGSASSKDISRLGDYIFRTYPSDEQRARKAADFITQKGYKKIAYIYETENAAHVSAMEDVIKFLGAGIEVKPYGVSAKDLDFRTIINQIKQSNPDLVAFSLTSANQNAILLKQLNELRVAKPFFTISETVQDNQTLAALNDKNDLVFTIFVPDESNLQYAELKGRYEGDTGANVNEVPQYLAENYDGTMIVLQALYQAKGDTVKAQKIMYEIGKNYQGKSGVITFDVNGNVNKMPVLMTVKNGKFALYEENNK